MAKKTLAQLIPDIEKQFHKGIIAKMSETVKHGVPCASTGSLTLDLRLGGGVPYGSILEVYGPEASGKTTLALSLISEVLKEHPEAQAVFIDAEQKINMQYCIDIGIDLDRLHVHQCNSGEDAFEMAEKVMQASDVKIVVIDSIARLVPQAELDGDMGDSKMGLHARLMGQGLRKIVNHVTQSGAILLFTNQLREKIGVMFGSPETTPGGNAMKYYAKIRLDVRSPAGNRIKEKDNVKNIIGQKMRVKCVKNQAGTPHGVAEFDFIYGQGIDRVAELVDMAVELDIITKAGNWHVYNEEKIENGRAKTMEVLEDNPELFDLIKKDIERVIFGETEA